jgi:DNA-binding NtrC family response regulator
LKLGQSALRLGLLEDYVELPLSSRERFGNLYGRSPSIRRVFSLLERICASDSTVLIEGETGTGKELVAEALHDESAREKGAFIVFDCSAVSANLFESELFGHKKGAFTGAVEDREGAFEAADGGTLFLDEIGELPLDLQPKLLRALEKHEVRRVGSNHPVEVDVRIVAATNRDLGREVERGKFREDLFYRLNVVKLQIPPLRERAEDIPLLVDLFTTQMKKPPLARETLRAFMTQAWPGNVRELRNAVERALSIGMAPKAPEEAPPQAAAAQTIDLSVPLKAGLDRLIDDYERAYVTAALEKTGGNVTRAAELAGVNRKFIQRALHRFGGK